MKRHPAMIIASLVFGIVASTTIGVGAALWSPASGGEPMHPFDATDTMKRAYPGSIIPDPPTGLIDRGFGVTEQIIAAISAEPAALSLHIVEAGWPARWLRGELHEAKGHADYWHAWPADEVAGLRGQSDRPFPLRILWGPAIGNVLAFAIGMFLVLVALKKART